MATETCADPSFGVHPFAQAVLHLLAGRCPEFAPPVGDGRTPFDIAIHTYTWVNGRERGASLVVFPQFLAVGTCCIFAFGEDRKSDSLFVEEWEQVQDPDNGPTVENRLQALGFNKTDRVYKDRASFPAGDVKGVADYIYTRMATWYKNQRSV